ncbi:hypothetical protein AN476_18390 [Phaeobacter sp. 11ANDIMAR09]|nr:hypothetical protein AN476_18390 [Phaeobacter sp. 11ANDIMAR09]OIQ31711.1 MAG: hypothetical protein BM559_12490 [Roseobacter sp. MedPE-SWchi]
MKMLLPVSALTLVSVTACGEAEFGGNDLSGTYGPATNYRNPVVQRQRIDSGLSQENISFSGNAAHWTTANGCTYSRTHDAGGRVVWYLVQNPHHVGQPNAHAGCAISVVGG